MKIMRILIFINDAYFYVIMRTKRIYLLLLQMEVVFNLHIVIPCIHAFFFLLNFYFLSVDKLFEKFNHLLLINSRHI